MRKVLVARCTAQVLTGRGDGEYLRGFGGTDSLNGTAGAELFVVLQGVTIANGDLDDLVNSGQIVVV